MAYMSQELKRKLAPGIKKVLKKYGVKGTLAVDHYSTLVVNIREGAIDFIGAENARRKERAEVMGDPFYECKGYYGANPYYAGDEDGQIGKFFKELISAMKGNEWYDNSDSMTDYFDTAYYLRINVGQFDRPYVFTKEEEMA